MTIKIMKWDDYVQKGPGEFSWIIDWDGLEWEEHDIGYDSIVPGFVKPRSSRKFCRAKQIQHDAYVELIKYDRESEEKRTDKPNLNNFYEEFFNLRKTNYIKRSTTIEIEKRKAVDFMTRWGFDHVDYTWMDTHHPTIIFSVNQMWNYQIDFADQYSYFNLKKDVLPDSELYKILESNLKRKFQPDNSVNNERSRLDEINSHLQRIDTKIEFENSFGDYKPIRQVSNHRDLVALAYKQLHEKILMSEKCKLKICPECQATFFPTNSRQNSCSLKCGRVISNKKYYTQIMSSEDKKIKRRKKNLLAVKKYQKSSNHVEH